MNSTQVKPTNRWLRFSLRSMLLLTVVVSLPIARHMHGVNIQRAAIVKLQPMGVSFKLEESSSRKWLGRWLGAEHVEIVRGIDLGHKCFNDGQMRLIFDELSRLPEIKSLRITYPPRSLTTNDYRQFARLENLQTLDIQSNDSVTGAKLVPLTSLRSLKVLHFEACSFGKLSFETICAIDSLQQLGVPWLTNEKQAWIVKQRPDLKVYQHNDYAP